LKGLDDKVIKDGESWTRLRAAFSIILHQWGNAAHLAAEQIGGQSVSRDHKGSKGARDPVVPVAAAKQRASLAFLSDQILSDRAFRFSPALLRKLAAERWSHWGNDSEFGGDDVAYPINEQILAIQKIVLNQCLDPDVLVRLANQENQVNADDQPLRTPEVFRALTEGIWSELTASGGSNADGAGSAQALAFSVLRRNLQREHLRRLCTIVLGQRHGGYDDLYPYILFTSSGRYPADARSLARMHLREIGERIDKTLGRANLTLDDNTRAHLEECSHRIKKVLDAGLDVNEP
jgi:hypothetical protein